MTADPLAPKNYAGQGGDNWHVSGTLDIESGGALRVGGNDVTTPLSDLPDSVAMATTPASGTCAVQFTFKNKLGMALSQALSGLFYLSAVDGLSIAHATSVAVLTNGAVTELKVGYVDHFITTGAGLLGMTVTASTGTYYVSFVLPGGRIITSGAIVVN